MKVLLAEDDDLSRSLIETLLTQWGYEAVSCEDGGKAWSHLTESTGANRPAIALIDWSMPEIDGIDLCKKIRKANIDCYLMMITANYKPEQLEEAIAAGADDYIHKGGHPEEIMLRLRAAETIVTLKNRVKELESAETELDWQSVATRLKKYVTQK